MLKKILRRVLQLLIVGVVMLVFLFYPRYVDELTYKGVSDSISRDSWGIPFIEAEEEMSFFYSYGWVQGEDRAFQLAFRKILMEGRLSEVVGQKTVGFDQMVREVNLKHWAGRMAERIRENDGRTYEKMTAFVDGLNDCQKKRLILPV